MPYSYLDPSLQPMADVVLKHLKAIGLKSIQIEKIDFQAPFAPTLTGNSRDGVKYCVEVNTTIFPKTLDSFIADCIRLGLPIKLYVAITEPNSYNSAELNRASKFGIGLFEVNGKRIQQIRPALELSLLLDESLKNVTEFPKKFRPDLLTAISTYENGDPKKGLSNVCELAEEISRNVAKTAKARGVIPASNTLDLDNGSWASVLKLMIKHNVISDILLSDWVSKTNIRNATNHPAKDFNERSKIHRRFRTNFGACLNSLKDLIDECKKAHYPV